MQVSRTVNFLVGKKFRGRKVANVLVSNNARLVVYEDGYKERLDLSNFMEQFDETMRREQRSKARRGIRKQPNGTYAVTIGGKVRGERKIYKTKSAALAAVTRAYGK